jgi:hypothetical protein
MSPEPLLAKLKRAFLRREFFSHRQAYAPSPWLSILAALLLGLPVIVALPWWAAAPAGALIGHVVVRAQWWVWRRQHPVVPHEVRARRSVEVN